MSCKECDNSIHIIHKKDITNNNTDDLLVTIIVCKNTECIPLHELIRLYGLNIHKIYCNIKIIGKIIIKVEFYYILDDQKYVIERNDELLRKIIDYQYGKNQILF